MKKILCMLLLLQMTALKAQEVDPTRETLDAILQIDNYTANIDQILQATGSTVTKEEFEENFSKAYCQKDFQENLINKLHQKFTSEQLEEIYTLITNDLYKKYCKEFSSFNLEVAPQIVQLMHNALQAGQVMPMGNHQEDQSHHILVADESNFDSILKEHDAVVVDVYATWCGPCKAISPLLQELSKEFEGKYVFVKIDADTNPALITKLKAKSLPTLIFYKDGKEVHRKIGFADKNQLINLMTSHLSS